LTSGKVATNTVASSECCAKSLAHHLQRS